MKNSRLFEKRLTIRTQDGLRVSALISKPIKKRPAGNVIMLHGLNNDKDEDGSFSTLSLIFNREGYNTLRFDFRAHGDSEGKSEDMTANGELRDLEAVIKRFDSEIGRSSKYILIASSFGAVSSILYTSKHEKKIEKLVLWNPVLDFKKTFLKAITPWGKTFFNPKGYRQLRTRGYVIIPETDFRIGRNLVKEFRVIKLYQLLRKFKIPVLTIHGTKDTAVPYAVSKKYGVPNNKSKFISHPCEHTFIGIIDIVIKETVEWVLGVGSK